ncbi:MAG: hypothetical protein HOV80_24015 [Polyangiaceae bacterium]|nr:hypothetical protein [Polyangiaceae bacterium]
MSISHFLGLFVKGLQTAELWFLIFLVAFQMGATYALQRALLSRMSPARRAQGWNGASWGAAILVCPWPFATMLPFCWVTRKRPGVAWGLLALLMGLAWSFGLLVAIETGGQLLMWLFGVEIEGV